MKGCHLDSLGPVAEPLGALEILGACDDGARPPQEGLDAVHRQRHQAHAAKHHEEQPACELGEACPTDTKRVRDRHEREREREKRLVTESSQHKQNLDGSLYHSTLGVRIEEQTLASHQHRQTRR